MLGTVIRGTLKAPNSQLVTPISIKLQRPDGAIKSGISPFEGLDHASPEPSLGQGQPTPGISASPEAPSSGEHISGSPEALSSPRSNPDQIAAPTDQIAGAFNAKVA
jgi:hypothetical protein